MTTAPIAQPYPARLEGHLDTDLSRWLWLVKWILVLPHVVVLVPLIVALVLSTIGAGIAILFTGRYPEGLFDFNVGVMRWAWRVSFYAFGAIGTDEYPPFTLERTDYPADFDVDRPGELSRGLVLVKWLLAIPHLIIVGLITNGAASTYTAANGEEITRSGLSVLGVLVVVAGVALLFTGRYPKGLFDLIVGLNRWTFRVYAYFGLMTDTYPPFRLDMGGSEREVTG